MKRSLFFLTKVGRHPKTEKKILHTEKERKIDNKNISENSEVTGSNFLLPSKHSHNYQKLSSTVIRILPFPRKLALF